MAGTDGREFDAVLFDLDGTLVDTAPDMVAVLQAMQVDQGRRPVDYTTGRSYVSNGAIGLLGLAFPELDAPFGGDLHREFLVRYQKRVCVDSSLFDGFGDLLDMLDTAGHQSLRGAVILTAEVSLRTLIENTVSVR